VSVADLQALWENDPAVVEAAQRRLEEAGADALPRLRTAAEGIGPEVRARHLEVIRRIERAREGCDVELTALALLAFEKDGDAVRRGLAWLVARQGEDGSFGGDDGEADWVAARAVIRWGHCGEAASRARRWLARNPRKVSGRLDWLRDLDGRAWRSRERTRCGSAFEMERGRPDDLEELRLLQMK
jgi:hypothetical protein